MPPEVSVEGQHHRWHQAQAEQPAAVAQLPPLPLPTLWPSMTQNEKLRKHRFWEWKKAHGGKMLCCVRPCLLLEKKVFLELFLIPHFLSPFKGLIRISIASLLPTALVCFFPISGEGAFYLLYLKTLNF